MLSLQAFTPFIKAGGKRQALLTRAGVAGILQTSVDKIMPAIERELGPAVARAYNQNKSGVRVKLSVSFSVVPADE